MQLRARMSGPCQTAAPEASRLESEITTVFLNQEIARRFRYAEQAVHRCVDGHGLVNAVLGEGVRWIQRPSRVFLN